MPKSISILIPTYNKVCVPLVDSLHEQAERLPHFTWEIIVADDGSTDTATVEQNRAINGIAGCRYMERKENVGRAAIRNFLAREAEYDWLLFIDSNMTVESGDYLANYLRAEEHDVVYGGYKVDKGREDLKGNLRYIFECRARQNSDHTLRRANPYGDFHTSNFMIRRSVMLACPFDERFREYGYEDVLFGKTLKENDIRITHVDNTLGYDNFGGNMAFVKKTEESLRTLHRFRHELQDYSRIISWAAAIERAHAGGICRRIYPMASLPLKARLTGKSPSLFLFNIYKLLYYLHLEA